MGLCHLKDSELGPQFQKYKGELYSEVCVVEAGREEVCWTAIAGSVAGWAATRRRSTCGTSS